MTPVKEVSAIKTFKVDQSSEVLEAQKPTRGHSSVNTMETINAPEIEPVCWRDFWIKVVGVVVVLSAMAYKDFRDDAI